MSGRQLFRILKPFINILTFVLGFLPNSMNVFLYDIVSLVPTRFGVILRYIFVKSVNKNIGDNLYIARFVILKNIGSLSIGDNVSFHEYCYIDSLGGLDIGDNVSIAHSTSILTFEHGYEDTTQPIKYNSLIKKPVLIGDDVWIGCSVKILSGSTIENRVIVGAGSLVKGHLDSNKIYVGSPAKAKKDLL